MRLLELPAGREVGECFSGCKGLLVVSFGKVALQVNGAKRLLCEGESCPVCRGEALWLRAEEWSDVLFFEETAGQAA